VDAETQALALAEVQQTLDHNQYYQDLLNYSLADRGF